MKTLRKIAGKELVLTLAALLAALGFSSCTKKDKADAA